MVMVLITIAVVLFVVFYASRRHVGAPVLAVIAGGLANELVNGKLTSLITGILEGVPAKYISGFICLLLVLVLPVAMYFRAESGLFGMTRIVQAITLSVVILVVLAETIANVFALDSMSIVVLDVIGVFSQVVVLAGLAVAYWDVLRYKSGG